MSHGCGCRSWETPGGDGEAYLCPRHEAELMGKVGGPEVDILPSCEWCGEPIEDAEPWETMHYRCEAQQHNEDDLIEALRNVAADLAEKLDEYHWELHHGAARGAAEHDGRKLFAKVRAVITVAIIASEGAKNTKEEKTACVA